MTTSLVSYYKLSIHHSIFSTSVSLPDFFILIYFSLGWNTSLSNYFYKSYVGSIVFMFLHIFTIE